MLIVYIIKVLLKKQVKSRLQDSANSSFKERLQISDKNLPPEIKVLKNLIEIKGLIIQKADKENTVVILNKNDQVWRLNQI